MSKYIIEIPDGVPYVLLRREEFGITKVVPVAELDELNSDYINEHYGELQDEAYKRGYEDGKKSQNDDPIEVGDEVLVGCYDKAGKVLSIVNDICYVMWEDKTVGGYHINNVRCAK